MTVPTVTMAISATIRLTLKTILKLLSHDMFGSVRLALPAARRATGRARPCECAFADLWVVFVRSIEHPCPKQYRSRRCISVNFGGRRNTGIRRQRTQRRGRPAMETDVECQSLTSGL